MLLSRSETNCIGPLGIMQSQHGGSCSQASLEFPAREARDRNHQDDWDSSTASLNHNIGHAPSKPHGCAKRGGRPVTWIGGGGMDPKKLAGLGVPTLRELFSQVFGEQTASNNAGWLRRKLAESPDCVHGQRRSPVVRARDMGAAIWNSPVITTSEEARNAEDAQAAASGMDCSEAAGASSGEGVQEHSSLQDATRMVEHDGLQDGRCLARRSLKRSAPSAESADTLGYRASKPHCPGSPSGSGSASPTAIYHGGSTSPRAGRSKAAHHSSGSHQQHHQHHKHKQQQRRQAEEVSRGLVIRPETFADSFLGCKVMVYWPADDKWWPATICRLSVAALSMQLLYSDMTEETVAGADFSELLVNGHLALAADAAPTCTAAGLPSYQAQQASGPHSSLAAATAAGLPACSAGYSYELSLGVPPDLQQQTGLTAAADGCQVTSCFTSNGTTSDQAGFSGLIADGPGRPHSCMLPNSTAAAACDSRGTSCQEFSRSASVSFGARISASGSGSGSRCGSGLEPDETAAKRPCYEASGNTSGGSGGSDATNPSSEGFLGFFFGNRSTVEQQQQQQQQQRQQQQGADASKLGVWFASQQLQQQQLQLQVNSNLQMQQQAQMQMHQQMAAHMSMQQAAGQLMHLQAPALSAPAAAAAAACSAGFGAGTALGTSVNGVGECSMPAPRGLSPFAGSPAFPVSTSPDSAAAATATATTARAAAGSSSGLAGRGLAGEIQQLKQLQLQLRQSLNQGQPAAAAAGGNPASNVCSSSGTWTQQGQQLTWPSVSNALTSSVSLPNMPQQQLPGLVLQGCSSLPAGSATCSPRTSNTGLMAHLPKQQQRQQQISSAPLPSASLTGLALVGPSFPGSGIVDAAAAAAAGSEGHTVAARLAVNDQQESQVVPQMAPLVGQQQQGLASGVGSEVFIKPEPSAPAAAAADSSACIDGFSGGLQEAAADDIDTLLSKPDEMFDLSGLGMDEEPCMQGMDGMEASADDGNPSSSCGNSSLCESVADELAVAGLEAEDAPSYYMFGGGHASPRKCSSKGGGRYEPAGAAAGGDLQLGGCAGSVGPANGGDNDDGFAPEYTQPEETAGNSFAHMFDFD